MHELSLAESIIEAIEEKSIVLKFSLVSDITLTIGALSCVEPDSLTWYLAEISENTPLANANIHVTKTPGKMHCNRCQQNFDSDELYCCCPHCNSTDKRIISGDEMVISHIEVIEDGRSTSSIESSQNVDLSTVTRNL